MTTSVGKGVLQVGFDKNQIAKDAEENIGGALKAVAKNAAALFVGKKLFDIGKAGLEELKEAEVVAAQTASAIRATGGAANVSASQIANLAGSLSEMSGKDDELIAKGSNLLLTFKRIANQAGEGAAIFDRATAAALDLSVSGFGSMESASVLLGKALNDPVVGLTALGRAGVTFSAGQKETIKQLVAVGDLLGAQKVILREVESQVGGAAKAYGQTLAGSLERAQTNLDNAKASLVQGFAPAIQFGADVTAKLAAGLQDLPSELQAVAAGVVFLGGTFVTFATPIATALQILDKLKAARLASAAAATVETAAEAANTAGKAANATAALAQNSAKSVSSLYAGSKAAGVFSKALGAAGIAGAALAAGAAIYYLHQNALKIEVDLEKIADTLAKGLIGGEDLEKIGKLIAVIPEFRKRFVDAGDVGVGVLVQLRDAAKAAGQDTSTYDRAISDAKTSQQNMTAAQKAGAEAMDDFGDDSDGATEALNKQKTALEEARTAAKNLQETYQSIIDKTLGSFAAGLTEIDAAIATRKALQELADVPAEQAKKDADLAESVADAEEAVADARASGADAVASAQERIAAAQEKIGAADTPEERASAQKALADAEEDLADAQVEASRAVADAQERLREAKAKQADQTATNIEREDEFTSKTNDALKAILAQAEAHRQSYEASVTATGGIVNAAYSQRLLIEELTKVKNTLEPGSPLAVALDSYITHLQGIPKSVETELQLRYRETGDVSILRQIQTVQSQAAADALGISLEEYLRRANQENFADRSRPQFAAGGWVNAPMGAPVSAIVHGGEYVISNAELANWGPGGGGGVQIDQIIVQGQDAPEAVIRLPGVLRQSAALSGVR